MRGLTGSIALVGGDEFRPGCEPMDRVLLEATGVDCSRVVILPTAAAHENPGQAAANGISYFSGLGCDASAAMVVDSAGASDEALVSQVDGADRNCSDLRGRMPAEGGDTALFKAELPCRRCRWSSRSPEV